MELSALPKVLLHDHLDGGLRPGTVLELAKENGHQLPKDNATELADWFDQRKSGSLELYLQSFSHTIGVMQSRQALRRVAREAALDLVADGVAYAEIRFAPALHTTAGLELTDAIESVAAGFAEGAETGDLEFGLIIVAMRQDDDSDLVVEDAINAKHHGVVGFDLAGPERGYLPDRHLAACRRAVEAGLGLTIHAGEAAGLDSIEKAIDPCGAQRLGHGVEIIEDCRVVDGAIVELGTTARLVHDSFVPLEVCPWSNLATKQWEPSQHPVGTLHRAGFNITLNTDNRLMSRTSMTREFALCVEHQAFTIDDLALITKRTLEAAFCSDSVKQRLWVERIEPAYASV